MKNIKFGVEIELGGNSRREASEIIARYFGNYNRHVGGGYDKWDALDRQGRRWTVMSDSSVEAGRQSCEVVTPLLSYDDIEDLQGVVRELRKAGYRANNTCGIHIHVDNTGMTAQQMKNLVNLVGTHEELIFTALNVDGFRRVHYCRDMEPRFKDAINKAKNPSMDDIKHIWYRTNGWGDEDRSYSHYDGSRYHLLNLHSVWQGKGIEFRCFNGTTHAGEIKAYIQFCLALVAKAKTLKYAQSRASMNANNLRAMRAFINHLGLGGDEFKTCRLHMTKNMNHGDSERAA